MVDVRMYVPYVVPHRRSTATGEDEEDEEEEGGGEYRGTYGVRTSAVRPVLYGTPYVLTP